MDLDTSWPEGDELISSADAWLHQRYEARGCPPFENDTHWADLEERVNEAYYARDRERLRVALRGYAQNAVVVFKRAALKSW